MVADDRSKIAIMVATLSGADGGHHRRVLICDDERHIARLLQVNFERQGHLVVAVYDFKEAIELLETAELLEVPTFDTVVLSALANGYELLSWIRTHESTRFTWVGMMIPKWDNSSEWERRAYRADRYVTKPFNLGRLFD